MKIPWCVGLVLAFGLTSCSKPPPTAAASPATNGAAANPLTAPVDYLGAVAKAKKLSEKTLDAVSVNQAIQLFYAQEDRFPKDLAELVNKHYLAAMPTPPPGMRWAYNAQTGDLKAVR